MSENLRFRIDRTLHVPLSEQIYRGIAHAIDEGMLIQGARLPSWIDLAAQIGVARGTVRIAYEHLAASQYVIASRSGGTRVAERHEPARKTGEKSDAGPFISLYQEMTAGPAYFQMGIPSKDALPTKILNRLRSRAVLTETSGVPLYPDPRGEAELRKEISAYLAVARGVHCSPSQIIITAGYAAGLGVTLRALRLEGMHAWMEDPGFPFTRHALTLAGLEPTFIKVDHEGLDVEQGIALRKDAALAVVTPGQQAPLGGTLSLQRRQQLLDWAATSGAWIIEDDYLSELQLHGRAAPALASLDRNGRVIHIGSFSKTLSPRLRLGFIVAPEKLVRPLSEVAACLAPAPGPAVQLAIAEFMREGHYLRHLRRMKRLYLDQSTQLAKEFQQRGVQFTNAALSLLISVPNEISDQGIAREAFAFGLGPSPLSAWFGQEKNRVSGLLLSVATSPTAHVGHACDQLVRIIERASTRSG